MFKEGAVDRKAFYSAELGECLCSHEDISAQRDQLMFACLSIARSRDEAEELCAAAILRAIEKRKQFSGERLDAWLFTIAKSIYINEWKKWGARWVEFERWGDHSERTCVQDIENRLMRNQILEWINDLPPRQRICVKLAHVDGLSAAEIAEKTDWTIAQVHKYLEHGRANLRKRYLDSKKPRKDH